MGGGWGGTRDIVRGSHASNGEDDSRYPAEEMHLDDLARQGINWIVVYKVRGNGNWKGGQLDHAEKTRSN